MSWGEFCTLLAGLMHDTPLGQIVSIRSESDKDTLKYFTKEQHEIRRKWRSRMTIRADKAILIKQIRAFQDACKQAFGK